jgi:hypothetical protein
MPPALLRRAAWSIRVGELPADVLVVLDRVDALGGGFVGERCSLLAVDAQVHAVAEAVDAHHFALGLIVGAAFGLGVGGLGGCGEEDVARVGRSIWVPLCVCVCLKDFNTIPAQPPP